MVELPPQNSTLLIIEDNITNLKVLVDYLEPYGFDILTARNGEAGIKKAQLGVPDLILLDIHMPGIDGFETCRRLKTHDVMQDIPIIFMTALTETEDKILGFKVGAVDYVTKPLEYAEVLARINTHLTIRNLQHQLRDANNELLKTNDSLEQQVAERTHRLLVRARLSRQMNEARDLDELFESLVKSLAENFGYDRVQIYILEPETGDLMLRSFAGKMSQVYKIENHSIVTGQDTVRRVAQTNQLSLNNDVAQRSAFSCDLRSELAIPLFMRKRVQGVLDVRSEQPNAFNDKEVSLLQSIAHELTVRLDNLHLLAEREATIDKLLELDRTKSRFLALVNHELRTPLGAIRGYIDLLLGNIFGELSTPIRRTIEKLHQSSSHMTILINSLLDMAQLESGQFQVDLALLEDVHTLVDEVVMALKPLLANKPVDIVVDVSTNLPGLYADRKRLYQILLNLGNNAIKFTPTGTITFKVERDKQTLDKARFAVIDTGVGISLEQQAMIFEPFRSVDMSDTRENNGLGLGLAICKQLVSAHAAELKVKSEVGCGSEFYFKIPLAPLVAQPD